jgi:AcrR family transcriptional regulator
VAVDNRAALLKGARQCLEQIGYARTTARDIASAAGVSLGAIGYHFGSKEELLTEAIADSVRDWIDRFAMLTNLVDDQGSDVVVRGAIEEFFRHMESSRPLLVAFMEALVQAEHSSRLREQLADQYRQFKASAVEMLNATLGPVLDGAGLDPYVVSSLLLALGDGLIIQFLVDPDAAPGADEILAIYESLTGGVSGTGAAEDGGAEDGGATTA